MKFLLIEDDNALAVSLQRILASHSYLVDIARDGEIGCNMAELCPYDLILMDWVLPKMSGIEICQQLRAKGDRTPIILITARTSSSDLVIGLDSGADDYIVKPFRCEELLARIRASLRRADGNASPILRWGALEVDPTTREVAYKQEPIALTPKEYGLLELFVRNPRRILSLENLLDKVWDRTDSPYIGAVRTHIKGLRQKLKQAGLDGVVETVYGLGYRLTANPPATATPSLVQADKYNLKALWQTNQIDYLRRASNLVEGLQQLSLKKTDKAIASQMIVEAHTLAGSLGLFGLLSATAHCRAIEQRLTLEKRLSKKDIHQLQSLARQIQQEIDRDVQKAS